MTKIIDLKWKIFFWINILWLLGAISIGYSTYTAIPPVGSSNIIETIKMVFLVLGGLGIVLPTYINATNTIESRHSTRLENTYSLIEKWDDPHLFSARKLTRDLKKKKDGLSKIDLLKTIDDDEDLKQSIILVTNYFEQIRFSSKTERIDVALFKSALGPVVVDICNRLQPYIESHGDQYVKDWNELHDMYK